MRFSSISSGQIDEFCIGIYKIDVVSNAHYFGRFFNRVMALDLRQNFVNAQCKEFRITTRKRARYAPESLCVVHVMNQSINTDSKNSKEPQQKYRLGTVSIKILGGLNRFYRRLTSPSASVIGQE